MPIVTLDIPQPAADRLREALIPYSMDPENPDSVKKYLIDCLKNFIRMHDIRVTEEARQALNDDFGIT